MSYIRATNIDHALSLLSEPKARVVCGGTDWMPGSVKVPRDVSLIDISRLFELRGIREESDTITIGSAVTWSMIEGARLPTALSGLRHAAREIGSKQIRNHASVGGNICNGSPAADGVTMLLALDASVVLECTTGTRTLALESFLLDKHKVDLRPGEMLTAVRVPSTGPTGGRFRSGFFKLGLRRQLNIAIVSAAVRVECDDADTPTSLQISAGSVARTPVRLRRLEEAALLRLKLDIDARDAFDGAGTSEVRPIDDVRASASYRRSIMGEVVARAYALAMGGHADAQAT